MMLLMSRETPVFGERVGLEGMLSGNLKAAFSLFLFF